jgi:N-acyl-phosphatidylethanolamine-hydrolysing phospholipase D
VHATNTPAKFGMCAGVIDCAGSVDRLYKRFGDQLRWYVPLGLKAWFTGRGISNVQELDWWQEAQHPGSKVR